MPQGPRPGRRPAARQRAQHGAEPRPGRRRLRLRLRQLRAGLRRGPTKPRRDRPRATRRARPASEPPVPSAPPRSPPSARDARRPPASAQASRRRARRLVVAVNAAAFLYLRDRMSEPPPAPTASADGPRGGAGRRGPAIERSACGRRPAGRQRAAADHRELSSRRGRARDGHRLGRGARGRPREVRRIPGLVRDARRRAQRRRLVGHGHRRPLRRRTAWRSTRLAGADVAGGPLPAGHVVPRPEGPATSPLAHGSSSTLRRRLPGDRGPHRPDAGPCRAAPTRPCSATATAPQSPAVRGAGVRPSPSAPAGRDGGLYDDAAVRGRCSVAGGVGGTLDAGVCFGNDKRRLGITWIGDDPVAQVGYACSTTTGARPATGRPRRLTADGQ